MMFRAKLVLVAYLKKPFVLAAYELPGRPNAGHSLMRSPSLAI
jgi:hypothetical protein